MLVCAFSWEQRKFSELTEIRSASRVHKDEWQSSGVPFYRSSDVMAALNGTENEKAFISEELYEKLSAVSGKLEKGDVLVTGGGSVGKPYIVPNNEPLYTKDADLLWIKNNENLDPYFVYTFFFSPTFTDYLNSVSHVGTIAHYTITQLGETPITLPCVSEQQKIGDYFRNLDFLITLHQRECFSFDFSGESAKTAQKTISWEQREFKNTFDFLQNNALSRADLSDEQGSAMNVHYGDILVKYGEVLDVSTEQIPYIVDDEIVKKYASSKLQNGDIIIADAAEDETVGKCTEIANLQGVTVLAGLHTIPVRARIKFSCGYLGYYMNSSSYHDQLLPLMQGTKVSSISKSAIQDTMILHPKSADEQQKIGDYFRNLDNIITLHQREPPKEDKILNDIKTDTLFHEYYCQWLVIYKEGSVRGVTMQKYHLTAEWVKKLIPDVKLCDFDRITYQQLINDYAETHERQTTMDFHHQLKGAILDAVDDGLIARDPTRKVIIKGKSPNDKKKKYLSRYELQKLLTSLDLNSGLNMDWLILLIAKTGMRFSEAIAVTPMDFDFTHQTLSVNKTWDYKGEGGFQPTKNKSSVRKIRLDWQTVGQFYAIVRELNDTAPIFVSKEKKIYNSTLNDVLERHCKAVGIPTISVHGLRHTHASLLLFDGVSIASVAQRLGHSSINTTQKTYLHIIRELENKDIDLIMKSISSLLD